MAKMSSMRPEAIGTVTREPRMTSRASRMERLLGFVVSPHPSLSESADVNEFKEDDFWEDELQDLMTFSVQEKFESPSDAFRPFTNSERWVDVGHDSGLSLAFAETRRGTGFSSLSSLNQSEEETCSRLTCASRLIPQIGVTSVDYSRLHMAPQSAPMNVPDWSKILGQDENKKNRMESSEDDEDEGEKLPPHEFLARQYARTQITTFSMLEGAGRTLKGRDLSKVRSAVWRQTGFAE